MSFHYRGDLKSLDCEIDMHIIKLWMSDIKGDKCGTNEVNIKICKELPPRSFFLMP
jgi:hypothetical protein